MEFTPLVRQRPFGHEICRPLLLEMDPTPNALDASAERHPLLSLISACFWVIRECFTCAYGVHRSGLIESSLFYKSGC